MESGDLAEDLLRFIDQYIDTVPHLEALLLMRQSAPTAWNVDALAARIYVKPAVAKSILDDFVRHGLVRATAAGHAFNEEWDAQQQILPRLAEAYSKRLARVATLIHSRGSRPVRAFARAFQLKDKQ